jgi:hypothetical protein
MKPHGQPSEYSVWGDIAISSMCKSMGNRQRKSGKKYIRRLYFSEGKTMKQIAMDCYHSLHIVCRAIHLAQAPVSANENELALVQPPLSPVKNISPTISAEKASIWLYSLPIIFNIIYSIYEPEQS